MFTLLLPALISMSPLATGFARVVPTSVIAAKLATELRQTVVVARPLRNISVLLDEPETSPAQRLADLTFALRASLVRDGATLRIERQTVDLRACAAARIAARRVPIEAGLLAAEANLRRYAPLGSVAAQVRAAQEVVTQVLADNEAAEKAKRVYFSPLGMVRPGALIPASRLTLALMRRLGANRLAALAPGEVRFLSDHPNAAESPLPPCADLLATYAKAQATYAGVDEGEAAAPAKMLLRLSESGAELKLFDVAGHRADGGNVYYFDRAVYLGGERMDPKPSGPNAVWPPLNAASRRMASLFASRSLDQGLEEYLRSEAAQGRLSPVPPPDVPDEFLHPERSDPLDSVVREGVLALPRPPGTRGLVAALADRTLDLALACVREGRLDVDAFERGLRRPSDPVRDSSARLTYEWVDHGGTAILRPTDPIAAEAALADRAALGRAVRRVVTARRIGIRDWAAVRLALRPSESRVTLRYLDALTTLRFPRYSQLGPSQASEDLALVGAALAGDGSRLDARLSPLREILRDGLWRGGLALRPSPGLSDLAVQPSTLLAAGALDRAQVALSDIEEEVMDRQGGSGAIFDGGVPARWMPDPLYPDLPGLRRSEARTMSLFESRYLRPRYRMGHRTTIALDVQLDGLTSKVEFQESTLQRDDLAFDQLPRTYQYAMLTAVCKGLQANGTNVPAELRQRAASTLP